MSKLDNTLVNFNDYSGTQALNTLLDAVGIDEIIDGINNYCYNKRSNYSEIIMEKTSLRFHEGNVFIFIRR
jgi:hypothetical protein